MEMIETAGEPQRQGTLVLVHGFGQTSAHWDFLSPELQQRGFRTITPDLPTEAGLTYEDYAKVVAEAVRAATEDGEQVDAGLHSMAGHLAPYLADLLGDKLRSIIYISASIGKPGEDSQADMDAEASAPADDGFSARIAELIPAQRTDEPRNTDAYRDALIEWPDGSAVVHPGKIEDLMFGESPPDRVRKITAKPRIQGRPQHEPPEEAHRLPGIPKAYILPDRDKIRNPKWAERVARRLGAILIRMSGDHSPAISRTEELADKIESFLGHLAAGSDTEVSLQLQPSEPRDSAPSPARPPHPRSYRRPLQWWTTSN